MRGRHSIIAWLRCVCVSVIIILVVGGVTRLTESGLSMVDWRPVMGILPPLSEAQWQDVFTQYKSSPEYKAYNSGMSVDGFKSIFFWEYLHRILGRIVGLLCLLPYLWFLFRKQLDGSLRVRGLCLILLVIAQGLMGWYMVKSGLVENPDVSHFRLAAHLGLAFLIFGLGWWTILDLQRGAQPAKGSRKLRLVAVGLLVFLCIQVTYGAFTSGLKAGYGFNTYPKMGDHWMPESLFALSPMWSNLISDKFSIQFIHRWLGTLLTISTIGMAGYAIRMGSLTRLQRQRLFWLSGIVVTQFLLGVATLLFLPEVQVFLPVVHQLVALFLFAAFLAFIHSLGGSSSTGKKQH